MHLMLIVARAVELYNTCLILATTRQSTCEYGHLRVVMPRALCSCSVLWTVCVACALMRGSFHDTTDPDTCISSPFGRTLSALYGALIPLISLGPVHQAGTCKNRCLPTCNRRMPEVLAMPNWHSCSVQVAVVRAASASCSQRKSNALALGVRNVK